MKEPAKPIEMELWSRRGGTGMAELFLDSIPLFREDLVDAIAEAGVDNRRPIDQRHGRRSCLGQDNPLTLPGTLRLALGCLDGDHRVGRHPGLLEAAHRCLSGMTTRAT